MVQGSITHVTRSVPEPKILYLLRVILRLNEAFSASEKPRLWYLIELQLLFLHVGLAARNELLATADCVCPGQNITYECTVSGGEFTLWNFDNNCSVVLNHDHREFEFSIQSRVCSDQARIVGQGIGIENNCFTSQLTVFMSSNFTGNTIGCYVHDERTRLLDTTRLLPSSGMWYNIIYGTN